MTSNNPLAVQLSLDLGVTSEQACIMCNLSANCDKCCKQCQAQGRECSNKMQECSQVNLEYQGARWHNWLHLVATHYPELRKYIPRKYYRDLNMQAKIYNAKITRR